MTTQAPDNQDDWNSRILLAQQILPLISRLHREHNVVTSVFGRLLINVTDIDIIKSHRYARLVTDRELPLDSTLPILQELVDMNLGTASIDLGRPATGFDSEKEQDASLDLRAYLERELAEVTGTRTDKPSTDVVLYGFGRIGRLLARILVAREAAFGGSRLRAIVVRKNGEEDLEKRASLLRRDSVHGAFDGTITVDHEQNIIWANGTPIQVIYSSDPSTVDYSSYGISDAVLVDNTGRWRDREGLSKHLANDGIAKVLLTAPGKGDVRNIVYGINHEDITEDDSDRVLSAASCTTNAITPVLKVINDRFGIVHGHVETVHSFTNDQNLIDNFHKGPRRGRAAGLNMVLTETGAAKAVAKALPELGGKLTGNAIRVPTPDVLDGGAEPVTGHRDRPRGGQQLPAPRRPALRPSPADRLHQVPGDRLDRLRGLDPRRHRRWPGHHRRGQEPGSLRLVRQRVRLLQPGHPYRRGDLGRPSACLPETYRPD